MFKTSKWNENNEGKWNNRVVCKYDIYTLLETLAIQQWKDFVNSMINEFIMWNKIKIVHTKISYNQNNVQEASCLDGWYNNNSNWSSVLRFIQLKKYRILHPGNRQNK